MPDLQLTIRIALTDEEQRAIAYITATDNGRGLPTRDTAERYLSGAMRTRINQAVRERRIKTGTEQR